MIYRVNPKNSTKISQLGFGCMRFPKKGIQIDQEKVDELILYAFKNGVTHFDTAYIYPGSEEALGKALKKLNVRKDITISTKLPIFMCKKYDDFEKFFAKELERLGTDYVDYYFMHMLCNKSTWENLKSIGIEKWIDEKIKIGQIKNIGFSFHGGKRDFCELVDSYDWDFCMIQFNYLDENNQAGYSGLKYANEKGLPVFIMEPLRGGLLATKLPNDAKKEFKNFDTNRSFASWGIRWVLNHKEVTCVLSGMNDMNQLQDNISTASEIEANKITDEEDVVYKNVVSYLNKTIKVPCTACGYCMPCPRGVDIPSCFATYNQTYTDRFRSGFFQYMQITGAISTKQSDASRCVKCKKCEAHCPQSIKISEELQNVQKRMHSKVVNPVMKIARKLLKLEEKDKS
ncbi:MAG: aldo/keto reductase [Clostridioides sp.]|jgi:predicted aldo/keto reductase-like oxidoreductase|nr:aldo/keto reductase [Clostridioides sp.]